MRLVDLVPQVVSGIPSQCPLCFTTLASLNEVFSEAMGAAYVVQPQDTDEERWCDCGFLRVMDGCVIYSMGHYVVAKSKDGLYDEGFGEEYDGTE